MRNILPGGQHECFRPAFIFFQRSETQQILSSIPRSSMAKSMVISSVSNTVVLCPTQAAKERATWAPGTPRQDDGGWRMDFTVGFNGGFLLVK